MGSKKIKVLHLIDSGGLYSGGLYGAEKMVLALAHDQKKMGVDAKIISVREPEEDAREVEREAERQGLEVIVWEMRPGMNFKEAWRIIKWANLGKTSLLHSHGYKFNVLIGFIPLFLRKIPLVSTVHGYTAKAGFSKIGFYQLVDRIALHFVECVVYVTGNMGEESLPVKLTSRRHVIPNGIPLDDIVQESSDLDCHNFIKFPYIIFVGRLSREKGCDLLLQALYELRKTQNIFLVVLGEGSERENLELQAEKLGVTKAVTFLGFQNDVAVYMKSAHALVIPSRMEGLPITLLEAMKYRVPVVAARVGGIPSVLESGMCGVLVEPNNVQDLVDKINSVFNGEVSRQSITDRAYRKFVKEYSSTRMVDQYLKVYRDLLRYD